MARPAHAPGINGWILKPGQSSTESVVAGIHRLLPLIGESARLGPDGAHITLANVAQSADESVTFEPRPAV